MKTKRLFLVFVIIATVTSVSAQVNLGVKGGVNLSNVYGEDVTDNNAKIGFHAGILADYEFSYNSAIQTGIFFTTKGFKMDDEIDNTTVNAMYLQLPVHYAYKLDVSPGTRIVFHGGPYAAYGIGGKMTNGGEMDTFGDEGLFERFDAGLGIGVGAEFGAILLDIGWDMGLVDVMIDEFSEGSSVKNQNAYLSIGYKF
ncbi:MAG: porin family protein [Fermentimonas sp.]|nr:porin family protein [Fermentimonas sp.]